MEKLRKRVQLVGRLAEIVDAVTQLIKQPRISIAIAERSSAAAKVECFVAQLSTSSYVGYRLSWRIVWWPRPSSGRGRSDGTGPPVRSGRRCRPNAERFIVRDKQSDNVTTD